MEVLVERHTPFDVLPEYLTPEEFRQYLGIARGTAYDLLRRGEVPSVKFGRLIRVPKSALSSYTETESRVLPSNQRRSGRR